MDYRFLGNTGLKVSELCLGAMTFGRETSEGDSRAMLNRFIEVGGNFIDSANVSFSESTFSLVGVKWPIKILPRKALTVTVRWRPTRETSGAVGGSGAS